LSQQFHPEFGYFHPGARLRRDVRVALGSFASGAVLGAIAIVAVYVSYAKPEDASAPAAAATSTRPAVVPERAMAEHRNQQQARPSTVENTAVIARLPIGRADSVDLAKLPALPATSHVSESVSSTHIPPIAVETSPDLRAAHESARSGSGRARARQEKASSKLIGKRDLVHRERRERSIGTAAAVTQWKEPASQAHASAYAGGRTVFWDWSR
jgi:type IV secretory pathway VirB10-like protein